MITVAILSRSLSRISPREKLYLSPSRLPVTPRPRSVMGGPHEVETSAPKPWILVLSRVDRRQWSLWMDGHCQGSAGCRDAGDARRWYLAEPTDPGIPPKTPKTPDFPVSRLRSLKPSRFAFAPSWSACLRLLRLGLDIKPSSQVREGRPRREANMLFSFPPFPLKAQRTQARHDVMVDKLAFH